MWNLFKEVWRSLSKNKITVTGLTILVFLTSGVFTVLHDTAKAMKKQYDRYKDVSRPHDLTVDLNLPISGSAYNNGYFINGLSKEGASLSANEKAKNYLNNAQEDYYDKPLKYYPKNHIQTTEVINFSKVSDNYFLLSNFINDSSYVNKYISRNDFLSFYNSYAPEELKNNINDDSQKNDNKKKPESLFKLDFSKPQKTFKLNHKITFNVYVKNINNNFELDSENVKLDKNAKYTFDKQYKLSDISYITSNDEKSVNISQLSTLFINFKTHQMTFDSIKGSEWENIDGAIKVFGDELAGLLGFKRIKNSEFVYELDKGKSAILIDIKSDDKVPNFVDKVLKNELPYKTLFNNSDKSIEKVNHFTFEANKDYNIPKEWAYNRKKTISYERKHYKTTYVNEYKKRWSGSFKTFMDNLISLSKDKKIPKEFSDFSYWEKNIKTELIPFVGNEISSEEDKNIITFDEVNNEKLSFAPLNDQPKKIDYNAYKFDGTKTIAEIENIKKIGNDQKIKYEANEEEYKRISNKSIAADTFIKIRNGALAITKQDIYKYVLDKKISKQNIGIRQSITIDSFDDNDGKKVYHFVNLGDKERKISGIQNNINNLVNENKNNSLNRKTQNIADFFKTKEIDPYISTVILNNAIANILPYPNYIKPDYDFQELVFTNQLNNDVTVQKRAKIYKLAKYIGEKNRQEKDYNIFANIGITFLNDNEYLIVVPETDNQNNIIRWRNAKIDNATNGIIKRNNLKDYLTNNKLTLKAKINENGFVEKVPDFTNSVFVPFGFRGPDVEVVNQALNENVLNLGVERLQKNILNSTFYSEGFIKEDTWLVFVKALLTTFNKNNFAKVFSSGLINFNVLPKIILDGIYEITHDSNGDYLRKFLIEFIDNIIKKVNEKNNTEEEKRKYIAQNIDNLFNFISLLSGNKALDFASIFEVLKISKDVNKFLLILKDLINSINYRKITDYTNEFFLTQHNKVKVINGIEYTRKLSVYDIMLAVLRGIEQKEFKEALIKLLDNIDVSYLKNFSNKNNPINLLLSFLPGQAKDLLGSLNAYKNDDKNAYKNILDGAKFFIRNFDFNTFINVLNQKKSEKTFSYEEEEFNAILNSSNTVKRNLLLTSLDFDDIIFAFLKGNFNTPGSNKRVKEELIKMFNLSSKGSSIEIAENKFLTIPTSDNDKIGFFELINLLTNKSNSLNKKDINSKNEILKNSSNEAFLSIENFINFLDKQTVDVDASKWVYEYQQIALAYFGWNIKQNNIIKISDIKAKVKEWKEIINIFKNDSTEIAIDNLNNSFARLSLELDTYKNINVSSIFNIVSSKLLSQLLKSNYGSYSYLKDIFPIVKIWFKIFEDNKISFDKATSFANDLLSFANDKEIVELFNSFDLFKPSAQNIVGFNETGFGISRSLANPRAMRNLLFEKVKGEYKNLKLSELAKKYPEFKNFIEDNSFIITQTISYIAASLKFNPLDNEAKTYKGIKIKYPSIFSLYIDQFINNFLQRDVIKNNIDALRKILYNDYANTSFESIGISDVLVNGILRKLFPQVLIWTLVDTNNTGSSSQNNSNLAYFIQNKLINFEEFLKDEKLVKEFVKSFTKESVYVPVVEKDFVYRVAIDNDIFVKLEDEYKKDKTNKKYKFFDIDLYQFFDAVLSSITGLTKSNNILRFNQPASYIAKVNYAFLKNNNKEIYEGSIPENPIELNQLLSILPDKYTLNVNGSKYIIVGEDISFDYFYPILDENNLQINTKDQAIVYVNDNGFDRIRQAFRGTVVKEYLTIKYDGKADGNLNNFKNNLETFVQSNIDDVAKLQRTYLYNELDPINPERSLRIRTIEQIIGSVSYTSNILLAILISLVTISVIFIIKRYIANKNKVIGILIAQGYTPLQIAASLSVFAIFTIVIGDIIGYITGFMLQGKGIRILESYWTVPIETLSFNPITLIISLLIPLLTMTILIIFIALRSLRYKAIDLMSGIVDVNVNELHNKYQKTFSKFNIKTKFGASLIFNSFWKLTSFAISVILASITTIIGFGTFGVFEKSINETYVNRKYNYKFDLVSPTKEGGLYNPFTIDDLDRTLYVPIGKITELNQYQSDYFAAGKSSAVNVENKNGIPSEFDGHVITQFSVNIKIDSSVSVDPFEIIYNSLPDTQKARILQLRDKVGYALTKSQKNLVFKKIKNKEGKLVDSNVIDINETVKNKVYEFFQYVPNKDNIINGKFFYLKWDNIQKTYNHKVISTNQYRDEYRKFLVAGYKWIEKHTDVRDYFVSFNGIILNPDTNETYTYLDSSYQKQDIRLYGYKSNSKQIKIVSSNNENLLYKIEDEFKRNGSSIDKPIPLIINNVSKNKFNLKYGDQIKLKITNKIDRFTKKIKDRIDGKKTKKPTLKDEPAEKEYTFYVYEYNPTFINNEFIIPKLAADKILGFDELINKKLAKINDNKDNKNKPNLPKNFNEENYKFNGIFSTDKLPVQLILSTSLYTPSGYSGSIDSFNIENLSSKDKKDFFDGLFGSKTTNPNSSEGILARLGYSDNQIGKFLSENFDPKRDDYKKFYEEAKNNPDIYIKAFAEVFDGKLFIPSAYTLESKDIEIGFTLSIAKTVQIIVTIVTILCFAIAIIILVIISTILINENERNIAIWSILGYSNKEKILIFFGIYIPFIIVSLIFAFPLAFGFMSIFSSFLTISASISIPLSISVFNVLATVSVVFGVFLITSLLSWYGINKVKAIDLLKGK